MDRKDEPAPSSTQVVDCTHYEVAAALVHLVCKQDSTVPLDALNHNLLRAHVEAALAQVDAIDRLTAAVERIAFPALELKKSLSGFTVRPKS